MSTAVGTPWTELLREVIDDDARTGRAQRLATTFTWCAMGLLAVVLVTALTVAVVVHGTTGWVPLAGGGGLLGLLGIAGWVARRWGRSTSPPNALDPPETNPALGGDDAAEPADDAS